MMIKEEAEAHIKLHPLDKTFVSKSPCKNCGGQERYTRDKHPCVLCHRKKSIREYSSNKDVHKKNNKIWHEKNKEYVKNKAKADYLKRKEKVGAAV